MKYTFDTLQQMQVKFKELASENKLLFTRKTEEGKYEITALNPIPERKK